MEGASKRLWYGFSYLRNFGIGILLLFWRLNIKYGLLFNHFFHRKQEHDGWKEPQKETFIKSYLPVIISNKTHLSKQVVPMKTTLKKSFVAHATFEGLLVISFSEIVKKLQYFLVRASLLWTSREENTKWILFMRGKFIF